VEEEIVLGWIDTDEELSGLGATQKKAVVNAVKKIAPVIKDRKEVLPEAVKRFNTRRDLLTKDQADLLVAGQTRVEAFHFYRNRQITVANSGVVQCIDRNEEPEVGITNFKGKKLDEGYSMLIHEIGIAFGNDAALTDPARIEYSSYGVTAVSIQNAEVTITLGGKKLLIGVPMRQFISWESGAAPTTLERNSIAVKLPIDSILWTSKAELEVDFKFPETVVVPAGNTFVSINLYGAGIGPSV
jgi:hypothetical protein